MISLTILTADGLDGITLIYLVVIVVIFFNESLTRDISDRADEATPVI
jgi:hypothetical protein